MLPSQSSERWSINTTVYVEEMLYIVWDWGGQSDFQILRLETPALGSEGHPPPSSSLPG